MKVNHNYIDSLILGHTWHISHDYAMEQLNSYLHRLQLLEMDKLTLKDIYLGDSAEASTYKIQNQVGIISMSGVMRVEDGLCSKGITEQIRLIELANQDPSVKEILLYVNSGGGESTAGTMLHNAIKDSRKPLYVLGELIASAAYNAALPAIGIFVTSTMSRVGSIGTMIALDKKQLEYYKQNFTEIYSNVSGRKNEAWRSLVAGDSSKLEQHLTENAIKFQEKVKAFRSVKDTALDGSDYFGKEALDNNLIDGILTMNETVSYIVSQRESSTNNIINQNNSKMNLLNRINSFFGFSASNESEVDVALNGLANNLAELEASITENARTAITAEMSAQMEELTANNAISTDLLLNANARVGELEAALVATEAANTSIVETLTNQATELNARVNSLNTELLVAKKTGRTIETNHGTKEFQESTSSVDAFGNVKVNRVQAN